MKIDLALLCDYAIVDRFGKLSIMGIFGQLWIQRCPVVHPRVHLVLRLRGRRTEVGQHKVRIQFLDEEDKEIINGDGVFDFSEPPAGVTEIEAGTVMVFDLPLAKQGRYRFDITVDDILSTTVPLNVALVPSSPSAGASGSPP